MVEKNKMFQLFANLFMCILCVLCILPFMLLFASSLTNERTLIQDGYRFFTTKIDFAAYKYILLIPIRFSEDMVFPYWLQ